MRVSMGLVLIIQVFGQSLNQRRRQPLFTGARAPVKVSSAPVKFH